MSALCSSCVARGCESEAVVSGPYVVNRWYVKAKTAAGLFYWNVESQARGGGTDSLHAGAWYL